MSDLSVPFSVVGVQCWDPSNTSELQNCECRGGTGSLPHSSSHLALLWSEEVLVLLWLLLSSPGTAPALAPQHSTSSLTPATGRVRYWRPNSWEVAGYNLQMGSKQYFPFLCFHAHLLPFFFFKLPSSLLVVFSILFSAPSSRWGEC